jgi:hypothetical protein
MMEGDDEDGGDTVSCVCVGDPLLYKEQEQQTRIGDVLRFRLRPDDQEAPRVSVTHS